MKKSIMIKSFLLATAVSFVFAGNPGRVDVYGVIGKDNTDSDSRIEDYKSIGARLDHYIGHDWGIEYNIESGRDIESKVNPDREGKLLRGNIGVFKDFTNSSIVTPYLSLGLGGEQLKNVEDETYLYEKDTQAIGNAALGLKFGVGERWRLLTEAGYVRKFDTKENEVNVKAGVGYGFNVLASVKNPEVEDAYEPVVEERYVPAEVVEAAPVVVEETTPVVQPQLVESQVEIMDSDGDGVADSLDKCHNTPEGSVVDQYGCHKSCVSYVKRVYFDTNSAKIRPEHEKDIKRINNIMQNRPAYKAKLVGRADSRGSKSHNQKLSQRRANSVKYGIVGHGGVQESRISTKAYGETRPLVSNATPRGMQKNRSVSIDLVRE